MFKFLKNIFKKPGQPVQETGIYPYQNQVRQDIPNFDQNILPIESHHDVQNIPGTDLNIGSIEKVFQITPGELVTTAQKKGVLCGCKHFVFQVEKSDGKIGIGGQCCYCLYEAVQLLNAGAISLQQVHESSLYCSMCAGFCQECKQNICLRHIQTLQTETGETISLCPQCCRKATETFLAKIIRFTGQLLRGHKESLPLRDIRF